MEEREQSGAQEKFTIQITYASGRSERFLCTITSAELNQHLARGLREPYIAFQLGDRAQLISIAQIESMEINPLPRLTDVPALPAERLGVTGTFGS